MAVKRYNVGPRMSGAVVHGDTVYLAGLTADDRSLDVKGQTAQILAKVDALLKQAGSDKSKVLSANIWLTDIATWSQMNEVWDKWVSPGNTPARATVEAKLAAPACRSRSWSRPPARPAAVPRPPSRRRRRPPRKPPRRNADRARPCRTPAGPYLSHLPPPGEVPAVTGGGWGRFVQ